MNGAVRNRSQAHLVPLWALLILTVLPVFPVLPVLSAQSIPAEGLVLRPDSTPVAGVRVVLHRVGQVLQGPLDSTNTDRRGRFRFRFRADTSAIYLLSARHSGIEYFSPPVHTNPARPDTAMRIIAYDTSSTAPISVEARHLVVSRPGDDGSRNILDLIVLRNAGQRTRVAIDSSRPTWIGQLPRRTMGLELGESDVSPEAVGRQGDSLIVTAPIAPGEKQLTLEYLVPAGHQVLELPLTEAVPMLNVLTEETEAVVRGGTLVFADSQILQGRSFRRWTGTGPAGSLVRVVLPGRPRAPDWILAALVAAVAVALAAAGWRLATRRVTPRGSTDELLERVADLDARYQGREAEVSAEEWRQYQSERARLKGLLESSLAVRGSSR
jgi:predicted DCC family thiol-disulfide oxidoreductase YuxK